MKVGRNYRIYTTDEVIKEYREILLDKDRVDINIRFKLHNKEINEELGFHNGRLMWLHSQEDFEINGTTICYLWERINIPVSFMRAAKSGKAVRVEHALAERIIPLHFADLDAVLNVLSNELSAHDLADVIINGRWYIKQ